MTLTPEERQRIYEEEKARLEAQERLKSEAKAREVLSIPESRREPRSGWAVGCLTVVGVIVGVLVLLFIIGSLLPSSSSRTPQEQPSPPPVDALQQEADFKALLATGVVANVDGKSNPPRVFVGRAFYALTYEEKEAAARKVSDYWATLGGKPGGGAMFDICDAYSGQKLYRWDYYKLKR
jgi:hypothetical protein